MQIDPLAACASAPSVIGLDGEIIILGNRVAVSYRPDAAAELAVRIQAAVTNGGQPPNIGVPVRVE